MKLKELLEELEDLDPELEVVVRIEPPPKDISDYSVEDFFGEYCNVTDTRNVLIEYGKLTIIGDWTPSE